MTLGSDWVGQACIESLEGVGESLKLFIPADCAGLIIRNIFLSGRGNICIFERSRNGELWRTVSQEEFRHRKDQPCYWTPGPVNELYTMQKGMKLENIPSWLESPGLKRTYTQMKKNIFTLRQWTFEILFPLQLCRLSQFIHNTWVDFWSWRESRDVMILLVNGTARQIAMVGGAGSEPDGLLLLLLCSCTYMHPMQCLLIVQPSHSRYQSVQRSFCAFQNKYIFPSMRSPKLYAVLLVWPH